MAINLNLTLLIQMANFFVAYFITAKFFLKPGYEAVKSDEERLRQITGLIIDEQEKLAQKQEYKRSRWQLCQNYFYKNRPELETETYGISSYTSLATPPTLTKEELEKKALEISNALKAKVLSSTDVSSKEMK